MRVPKLGVAPVVITVLEGVAVTAITAAMGVKLLIAVLIGGMIFALFAFISWLIYRLRKGASIRLNTYFSNDGEANVLSDFAAAQPFADNQFRLGRHYLFIKNGAVLRLVNITDVIKMIDHYRFVPTGVSLSVRIDDENGSMAFPLCRVKMLKARAQTDEIYNAIMQRRDIARNENR